MRSVVARGGSAEPTTTRCFFEFAVQGFRTREKLISTFMRSEVVPMSGPDVDRWRAVTAMLAVVAALAGGALATSGATSPDATNAALCGESCQHNQVLL